MPRRIKTSENKPPLLIALGNPGEEYALTRHNAGAMFAEWLVRRQHGTWTKDRKGRYRYAEIDIDDVSLSLAIPGTYMNESGRAAEMAAKRLLSTSPRAVSRILLAHDDKDIALGQIKMRAGGRSGGHRGVQSVIHSLKSESFARLKIGILSELLTSTTDTKVFVLEPFTVEERHILEISFESQLTNPQSAFRQWLRDQTGGLQAPARRPKED